MQRAVRIETTAEVGEEQPVLELRHRTVRHFQNLVIENFAGWARATAVDFVALLVAFVASLVGEDQLV